MPIKKIFIELALFFYKLVKALFIIVPLVFVATLFLNRPIEDTLDALLKKDVYIVYISIGVVLYAVLLGRISRRIYLIKNSLNSIVNPLSCTSEADIVSLLGNRAAGSGNQDLFPAAFPAEEINIRVYRDAEEPLAGYKTFGFDYINKTNPLLEKELCRQLEKTLQAHGLTRAEKDPQITISMDFFIGKKEQYTPSTTVTSTELKSVWNYGMIGWNVGGFSSQVPIVSSHTTSGYTTISYYSNIRLNFLNHAKLVSGAKLENPPLIWIGEADSEGLNPDIRGIASVMFNELIRQFSDKSADSSKCHARRSRYGGLGLKFDPWNWRVIRYVEPFSVAAEKGIKPGDVLMQINSKSAGNWPAFSYGRSNPGLYSSKDPYFQYVLSNRGDSEVELVISSAGVVKPFRKNITLRVRPRREDRYACI